MTITTSRHEENLQLCREQVRQILRNVADFKLTFSKPVEPPRITHVDVLMREVQELNRTLDRVQSIINLSAQGLLSAIVLGCGTFWAFGDIPLQNIVAAAGIASSGTAALWACITFSLRDL
jgi:hypothetical protein